MGSNPIRVTILGVNMDIKSIVKDNTANFVRIRQGYAYYAVRVPSGENGDTETYEFPVPLVDIGDATFNWQEKAMTLMRWIRKALDDGTFVKHY
jgi:hypothetical protein